MKLTPVLICLAIFHSPDGSLISIDTNHIVAIRPADAVQEHVHPNTRTIIYTGGKNFGVAESKDEVDRIIEECN